MRVTLNTANDQRTVPGQGNYLYVDSATGPFMVTVVLMDDRRAEYSLEGRNQLRFPADIRQLEIENRHTAANTIDLATGFGEFLPNNDGQRVSLTGQDITLEIEGKAGGLPVTVTADALGATNDTSATSDGGNFSLIALVKRLLGKLPGLGIKTAANSQSVTLASDHAAVPVQHVTFSVYTPGATITGGGTIPANPDRDTVTIKAPAANTGFLWTGGAVNSGDMIEPGERITLRTTSAISIHATVAGDKACWSETEA